MDNKDYEKDLTERLIISLDAIAKLRPSHYKTAKAYDAKVAMYQFNINTIREELKRISKQAEGDNNGKPRVV
jgi:hypothetical protein